MEIPIPSIEYQNHGNIAPQTDKPADSENHPVSNGMTQEGLAYLKENFANSYEKRKLELEEKLKGAFR